jgi:two-component system chemotaxis response regulator CheB
LTKPALLILGLGINGRAELGRFLRELPAAFSLPMVVVEEGVSSADAPLAEYLASCSDMPVQEVIDKDPLLPGRVYLGPSDYHLQIDHGCFSLSTDSPVRGARPSFSILCETAQDVFGDALHSAWIDDQPADSLHEFVRSMEWEVKG